MSPQAAAELLISPPAIALSFTVATASTWLLWMFVLRGRRHIQVAQIVTGFATVVVVMFGVGWAIDFSSVDNSWASRAFLTYFAVMAMALFGVPVVGILIATGRGSVPWCLLGSGVVTVLLTLVYFAAGGLSSRSLGAWAVQIALIAAYSLLAMLSFCIGARIPWRMSGARV